ncbi:hypothetical protein HHK36_032614 [Tetracentron sinense]|uniref:Uncharacterized protein n=1 Tax=Tetracentron sinense TaxID=13715 RepID=A0A835CXE9_TETSI|nr:hypothetical protein HHK36_032614 [Tetracentron sinense]
MHELSSLNLQQEDEICILKGSLSKVEDALEAIRIELRAKVAELEQSEQRVSSAREKLSIAVAKGKGLIVQRDNLKHSLAETSSELDRCSQELQMKDARLQDRRDSEDLELPEHFHSRDIIEKIEWLARSVAGNTLPLTDWDQKSSGGGGSYSDAGFVVMDAWKEDVQQNSNTGDELRRKYEELQSKFYGWLSKMRCWNNR